jgi:hypothetical protein
MGPAMMDPSERRVLMRRNRTRRGAAAVAVMAAVAGGLLVAPPPAHAEEAPLCHLGVTDPFFDNSRVPEQSWITGEGERLQCRQTRNWVTVRIKRDVPIFADDTVAEKTVRNVVNTVIPIAWFCDGLDGKYFLEIETNAGGKATSSHLNFNCR